MDEPCLVRVDATAVMVESVAEPAPLLFGRRHDDPGDDIGVAVDELGHAVDDEVGAEFQRALQEGSGEGVVDN